MEGASFFARGPEGYERKDLGTGISLCWGSVRHFGLESHIEDFEIWLKGALEVKSSSFSLSLYCSSVKGTWREDSLAGDPEGNVKKVLEKGIFFHRGSVWETWRTARLPRISRTG